MQKHILEPSRRSLQDTLVGAETFDRLASHHDSVAATITSHHAEHYKNQSFPDIGFSDLL
jgi:hypothetical protein